MEQAQPLHLFCLEWSYLIWEDLLKFSADTVQIVLWNK